jgi:hypothetical protein
VVTCEGEITTLSCNPLPYQNPRSPGTSPLGLTSLKRKNHPIVATLGGISSCYASLTFKPQAFYPCYKLCNNRALEELFNPLDLANIQGGLHDLPKDADSWIPTFAGEIGAIGNTHWTKFCENYEFHLSGNEHLDTFMRLCLVSLTGDARKWSTKLPSKSLKTCEDLEQVFLKRWGVVENMAALYARYIKICKQDDKDVREFNDRFNTLLS